MRTSLIVAGTVIALILIGAGVWFFMTPAAPPSTSVDNPPFPIGSSTQSDTPKFVGTNDPQVAKAVTANLDNPGQYTFYGSNVVMPYALQNWGDQNAGNEALLKYDSSTGWQVVSLGGGAWDLASLEAAGVPEDTANQLLAKE